MKKIALIANLYGPKSGGLRTCVNELAKQYVKLDHEVLIIVPGVKFQNRVEDGVTRIELPSTRIPFSGGYRLILNTKKVIERLSAFNPNRIEISDRTTMLRVANWARKQGIPTAIFAHERLDGVLNAFGSWLPFRRAIARRWNAYTAEICTKVIATTQYAAEEFLSIGYESSSTPYGKLNIVPLGVDLELFHPTRRLKKPTTLPSFPERYILAATRCSGEKDPFFLLEIARELLVNNVKVPLVIAGSGPLQRKMIKKVKNNNLDVLFTGFVDDRKELAKMLAGADAFLAVGPIETFGLAALEALASGTPVICRESAAISEVIDDQCGLELPRNASTWATAIDNILKKDRETLRQASRSRAENFSWTNSVERLVELHEGIGVA